MSERIDEARIPPEVQGGDSRRVAGATGMGRRRFLKIAVGTALGAAGLEAYKGHIENRAANEEETRYRALRESVVAAYEKTGVLPPLEQIATIVLHAERDAYTARTGTRISLETAQKQYQTFLDRVLGGVRAAPTTNQVPGLGTIPTIDRLERLVRIKHSVQHIAGGTYNQEHSTLLDPILEQKYQCRSGTLGLLMAVFAAQQKEKVINAGDTLVAIYTEGHVEPGVLTKEGTLIGLEMTTEGAGIREFGLMQNITQPIRVVRADHGVFQDALGGSPLRAKAILYDTAGSGVTTAPQASSEISSTFGFGYANTPSGDQVMASANALPADQVFHREELFNRMQREPSEEELLMRITNPEERQFVRDYVVHVRVVIQYYNTYVEAYNAVDSRVQGGIPVSRREFAQASQITNRLADAVERYVQANNLDARYERAHRIGQKHSLELPLEQKPSEVAPIMRRNLEILQEKIQSE
ncbi:MAG: hypothetical protein HZB10_01555 [Candidatus Yonathbacteria bacterium]|nr:hypothetical protein [Candidatus Yonathbacteria bacterium]